LFYKKLIVNFINIIKKNKNKESVKSFRFGTDFGLVLLSVRKLTRSFWTYRHLF